MLAWAFAKAEHAGATAALAEAASTRAAHLCEPQAIATVALSLVKLGATHATAKRRDGLVWQTRLRMRQADADAGGVAARTPSKRMVPNAFVPVTEKRREIVMIPTTRPATAPPATAARAARTRHGARRHPRSSPRD